VHTSLAYSVNRRPHCRAVPRSVTNLVVWKDILSKELPQAVARAYLFPLMGPRRIARVQYDPEDSSQPGGLPRVHSNDYFECRQSTLNKVYDAIVEVGSHRFKVYGWTKGSHRGIANHHLRQIKPSTVWRGEVMVICLGTRKAFLSRPRMVISAIEEVVSM